MGDIFEVQDILDCREKSRGTTEYLIRWKGYSSEEDSWEPEQNLLHCQELLDAYNNRSVSKTPAPVSTAMNTPTTRSRRTRVMRNTPKVQRVLGVKEMPSNVKQWTGLQLDNGKTAQKQKRIEETDRPGYVGKCNLWAMVAGVVCLLIGALLLAYPDIWKQ